MEAQAAHCGATVRFDHQSRPYLRRVRRPRERPDQLGLSRR
jgi:hypothetical protein